MIFQVTPHRLRRPGGKHRGSGSGSGASPAGAVASAAHASTGGVLGTAIGMPMTGSDLLLKVGLSTLCVTVGIAMLGATMLNRRKD